MGKNRGSGRKLVPLPTQPIAGLGGITPMSQKFMDDLAAVEEIQYLTEDEVEALIQKWKDHYPKLQEMRELLERKGPKIVTTIIGKETFACEKCGGTGIPKALVVKKGENDFHVINSSIAGGGSRFCGPVMPELKKEEVKP